MINPLNFNVFNIIIIFGAIQGILYGLIVLKKNKLKPTPNFYLALVVLFLSFNNLYYWFIDTLISNSFKYYEFIYVPFKLLVLPMYFFFVTSYLGLKEEYKKYKKIIFLPFYFFLILYTSFNFYVLFINNNDEFILDVKKIIYYSEEYFSAFFSILVIIKSFLLIKRYEKNNIEYSLNKVQTNTNWLKQVLLFGLIICFVWISIVYINHLNNYNLYNNYSRYFLWVSITLLVYWIGYLGIYHISIFNQRIEIRKQSKVNNQIINFEKVEKIDLIKKNIIEEKLFLNPNLNLQFLAERNNLNMSYLSQIFNKKTNTNFNTFINRLRVEEAKKLLVKNDFKAYDIISIGLEAGFNSKSAFYKAFKRETTITPAEYRKRNKS